MRHKSVITKAAGSAAAAGALFLIFSKVKNRLTPRPVNLSIEYQTTDMKLLSEHCRKQLNQKREACGKELATKAERQTAALLLDCGENGLRFIEQIRPEAQILSNTATVSPVSKIVSFLFGPIISFFIALAVTFLLISFKWKIEQTASREILEMLNPLIIASAAVVLHLFLNIIVTFVRNAPERSMKITLGVKFEIPPEALERSIQTQQEQVKEYTAQIRRSYASPSKLDDPTLMLLAETYCDIYQAEKTEDMTDIFGFIKPKCAGAIRKMDVEIVDTYSEETAHLFSVIEAPGYAGSMVIKPALVLKTGGNVITKGEYVKKI